MAFNFRFTAADLTERVNRVKVVPPRLRDMGLFNAGGFKATTNIDIPLADWGYRVLANRPRGGDVPVLTGGAESAIVLKTPYTPSRATIAPGDIQDQWYMGDDAAPPRLKTLADITAERLQQLRENHALTREFMSMQALGGELRDGENTLIYDFFEVFGITRKIVHFDLSNPAADVREKTFEVARHVEDNLNGETKTGIHALVSPGFFSNLVSHPNVEKFYLNHTAAIGMAGDPRQSFVFGAMVFEEDNRTFPCLDGVNRKAVPAGKGRAFPLGTRNTFRTYFSPPHKIGDANRPGMEVYVSPKILDHDQGVEFLSESSCLPICVRPELLVELDAGAAP